MLPRSVRLGVERALRDSGSGQRISSVTPEFGGFVSHGCRIETDAGTELFLKWFADVDAAVFSAEEEGLEALRETGAVRVPRVHGRGQDEGGAWLLLEFIRSGRFGRVEHGRLGAALAEIHATRHPGFGWSRDNWIGSLPQANGPCATWGAFWRDRRLGPQIAMARARGQLTETLYDRVLEHTVDALASVRTPVLVHGDLWNGNALGDENGTPVLIDPAVYAGHGEVDLAMAELFGGFHSTLLDRYWAASGHEPAYDAYRRDLYQLYYLLVHVNLFGGSYVAASASAAGRFLSAWVG